jgi:hypothetical protein
MNVKNFINSWSIATEFFGISVDGHIFIHIKNVYKEDILHRKTMTESLQSVWLQTPFQNNGGYCMMQDIP